MPFLTDTVRCDVDGATARLVDALTYEGDTDMFTVPAGFVTDFASVPQYMTWLVPKMGTYTKAAILHDALCVQVERGDTRVSAVDVDGILRRVR
jgi:hypothetical protein